MAAGDPLYGSLIRLCGLAETTDVTLRVALPVREGLASFAIDADTLADELAELAARGREAHTARLQAKDDHEVAMAHCRSLAEAAYADQTVFRKRLDALEVLLRGEDADDIRAVRHRMNLRRPRVTSTHDVFHRLANHLELPDHVVTRHAVTASMPQEARAHARGLAAAIHARDITENGQRDAVSAADAAVEALVDALRRLRQLLPLLEEHARVPASLFSHLAVMDVPEPEPDAGVCHPDPAVDPATSAVNPATSAVDPATSAVDPATSAVDPATSAVDPATSAVDPATSAVDPASTIEP